MLIKGREDLKPMTREELVDELLSQRAVLQSFANNRAMLMQEVRAYEKKYNRSSEDVHAAIDRGELEETNEIADWLIAYESLKGLNAD